MSTNEFRDWYILMVESYGISQETAMKILKRIIEILNENKGEKRE